MWLHQVPQEQCGKLGSVVGIDGKAPQRLIYLNTWSLVGGTALDRIRRCDLGRGVSL